jgi:hypothetical protein
MKHTPQPWDADGSIVFVREWNIRVSRSTDWANQALFGGLMEGGWELDNTCMWMIEYF